MVYPFGRIGVARSMAVKDVHTESGAPLDAAARQRQAPLDAVHHNQEPPFSTTPACARMPRVRCSGGHSTSKPTRVLPLGNACAMILRRATAARVASVYPHAERAEIRSAVVLGGPWSPYCRVLRRQRAAHLRRPGRQNAVRCRTIPFDSRRLAAGAVARPLGPARARRRGMIPDLDRRWPPAAGRL